ncbi:antibiotic biosynthesis monooxygenase family protein [Marinobacter sp. M1N3S26]|uniref:antibiotic biosynthesis monooxygenase family protein n=1 Tax=unclassified Marinobacter TaxID=83889 RepID=UPI00387B798F
MYIAMNRFRIAPGKEEDFIEIWRNRDSHLEGVSGFREFHLLQGPSHEDHTLFTSHSVWDSEEAFVNWTKSEAFRKAHANASPSKDIYLGPPQFEGFKAVL